MKRSGFTLVCVINYILIWPSIASNSKNLPIYSLVTDLQPLLEIQSLVIHDLAKIIAKQKSTFTFFKSEMKRFKIVHKKTMEGTTGYLKNHINRYTLVKRLSRDFSYIKNQIEELRYTSLNRSSSMRYPSPMDLDEAGRVVLRLQRVYRIDVAKLADGLLESAYGGGGEIYRETFLPMTPSDCFELSKVIYENKFYRNGIIWLLEALRLFAKDKPKLGLKKYEIIEAISNGYKKLNKTAKQVEWAKKLVGLKPNFDEEIVRDIEVRKDIKKLNFNKKKLQKENKQLSKKLGNPDIRRDSIEHRDKVEAEERRTFHKLCRGEQSVAREVKKRLKCRYFAGHHPFSRLARFRVEQLFVRPEVLLVHNAVSDMEIHTMINIAEPQLKVLPVAEIKATKNSMIVNLSKGKKFDEDESRYIEPVTQRLSDITGYFTTFHRMVVTNYGVGGYYTPHMDSSGWWEKSGLIKKMKLISLGEDVINDLNDNIDFYLSKLHISYRIATVLLYLSDVQQGGFTVFPLLGLAVPPERGAALVWTNVLPSGRADPLMMHAACPVLRGSKWVATKWINGTAQELKKPCTKKNTSRSPDTDLFQRQTNFCFPHKKNIKK